MNCFTWTTIVTKSRKLRRNKNFHKYEYKECIASGWHSTFIWKQKKTRIKLLSPPYLIPCDIHEWIFISEIYVSAGHVLESKTKMKDENKANKEEVWGKRTCKARL